MTACAGFRRRAIDLYQIHGPYRETPAEETLRVLDELVRRQIRYFGGATTTRR